MTKKMLIPKELTDPKAVEFYRRIVKRYDLTDAGLQLLEVGCFTLQRWTQARKAIDAQGLTQGGQAMTRLNPLCKCEHDARLSFCRCLKELNLDSELIEKEIEP